MTSLPRRASISAVLTIDDASPPVDALRRLGETLARDFLDSEIVLIAASPPDTVTLALKLIVETLPDISVRFLATHCEEDVKRLIGFDSALGDWVVCLTPDDAEIDVLPRLFAEIEAGHDVVVAEATVPARRRPGAYRLLERLFFGVLNRLIGSGVRPGTESVRLYSRAAALQIANSANGEILLRSSALPGGFATKIIASGYDAARPRRRRTLMQALRWGTRMLVMSTAVPLRGVTLLGIAGGVLSLLYSLYVIGIYFLKPVVAPGWTTISLQVSGLMLLFSIIFAMMAEYLLQIHATSFPRRRYVVVRELRSRKTRRSGRLNVVDEAGRFHVGGPLADVGGERTADAPPAAAAGPADRKTG